MTYHVGCVIEPYCGMVSYRSLGGDLEEVGEEVNTPESDCSRLPLVPAPRL